MQPGDTAGPKAGNLLGIRPGDEDVESDKMKQTKNTVKEEMRLAIEGLARMERRLRSATKRQKLQIEEDARSSTPRRKAVEQASRADPESAAQGVLQITKPTAEPEKGGQLPTPEEEGQEGQEGLARAFGGKAGMDPEEQRIDAPEEAPDIPERGAARPPPVNSGYLPLPWKGRLGYACLNTYLRSAKNPVFCSRTCRLASIIDHRYPLLDESQPEHSVKNRPDKTKEPSVERGQKFVQNLGLANARDIVRMLRWNDKYGIKFMRLSSEMFPFASHPEHGYRLAPFASEVLAEAGKVAAELGHRLTCHPGQYTQRKSDLRSLFTRKNSPASPVPCYS
jgi:UV DNA damage endonuclease